MHYRRVYVDHNEESVGRAIRDSEIPRDQIFLVTKVHPKHLKSNSVYSACIESLKRLGTDYVDLYLIHWPGARGIPLDSSEHRSRRIEAWKAMQKLFREGKCKRIGVSNFMARHLLDIITPSEGFAPETPPFLNQIEIHPMLFWNAELQESISMCRQKGILVQAYCSLGQADPELIMCKEIQEIARKSGKTPAQILLRWAFQKNVITIPKTVSEQRLAENLDVFDFTLSNVEMDIVDSIGKHIQRRYCWDPTLVK